MSASAKRILIVDDLPENIGVLNAMLKDDYRIVVAQSGAKAVELAGNDTPPDLILLDLVMPEMDGYAVLQALQADPNTAHIPVIFVSGEDDERHIGLSRGAKDFLVKPIDVELLMATIKRFI